MFRLVLLPACFALCASLLAQLPMLGFSVKGAEDERSIERQFDQSMKPSDQFVWLKRLSAKPHHVGSPYGLQNAEYARDLFRSWGFDAQIERFYVLFPSPKFRLLEMTGPTKFKAKILEPTVKGDETSGVPGQLPPYNAYSADGDVTAGLVYVNFGMPADYETLGTQGINVKGKIVIARYGGGWRGIKPKVAAEHGAVGCLIYSDPKDDGYAQGDVYPKGAYRNENGVQRGSVADMPIYPGDPLTPGIGATKDAKRLKISEARTLVKIPCQPISYADAEPLLRALGGRVAPESWRGALPITYHIGPGPATVHLKLQFNWDTVEARDVVARLKGSERPDEWIIRGNHYDGWVFGAEDPLSGAVALLSEAKAVGELAKIGLAPKRTVIYCLWDGEEPGLLGSTEWCETHAEDLTKHGALYINSDSNGRGYFGAEGSQTLERFIGQVERDATDPETNGSVLERHKAQAVVGGDPGAREKSYFPLGALGSGSDFSPFLQHLGIASLNIGFGGEGGGGSYHSTYDSFDYYTRFGDPGLLYGAALAKAAGLITLRAANADVLPFEFDTFLTTLDKYVHEVIELTDAMRKETDEKNRQIKDGTIGLTVDPSKPTVVPQPKDAVPHLNFAPLQNAVEHLKVQVTAFGEYKKRPGIEPAKLDDLLMTAERRLLSPEGLPRRAWYRHAVDAPGAYTGYGVKTLPGVREAIEARNWKEAQEQIEVAAKVIEGYSGAIAGFLAGGGK